MIGVVLAAGAGRRLGGVAKALLCVPDTGLTFLSTIAAAAREAGTAHLIVVVARPFAGPVGRAARDLAAEVVENPAPERGMGSSVALGFAAALAHRPGASEALLWPVDHPFVDASTVKRLRRALGRAAAVVPTAAGRGGHPLLVARRLWPELARCGDLPRGARSVLERCARDVVRVEMSARVCRDVDHPGDLPGELANGLAGAGEIVG